MTNLVLTVLGDDRPGLVDTLSGVISDHGGSWEHSQMARLGGKFAGIVQVSVPEAQADALVRGLHAFSDEGALHVEVTSAGVEPAAASGHRFELSLMGTDQPGLVHAVSAALAAAGASIESLTTDTLEAPMSGGTLFSAYATVVLPESVDTAAVRAELERLAGNLMVDIDLSE
jgi:glycine cleavage system regulatory protein